MRSFSREAVLPNLFPWDVSMQQERRLHCVKLETRGFTIVLKYVAGFI
jgi:hypothetical protein